MLIDNLKDINCVADLFQYIANVETELEQSKAANDKLLILNDSLTNRVQQLEKELAHTEATLEFYESKVAIKKEKNND